MSKVGNFLIQAIAVVLLIGMVISFSTYMYVMATQHDTINEQIAMLEEILNRFE